MRPTARDQTKARNDAKYFEAVELALNAMLRDNGFGGSVRKIFFNIAGCLIGIVLLYIVAMFVIFAATSG